MATSTFFNNIGASSEQRMLEDLAIESIRIYGIDFYYLPKTLNNLDKIYGQDDIMSYESATQVEMYVRSYQGFEGEGSFFSKFGLEIRDQITFTIAKRVFDDEVGQQYTLIRPQEGDLVYYPPNHKLFQIKYVDNKPIHYPLGTLPTYDLFCELFEYSNERFHTGISEIDSIQSDLSTDIYDFAILSESGKALTDENGNIIVGPGYNFAEADPFADNIEFAADANDVIDFTESNPFAEEWPDNI